MGEVAAKYARTSNELIAQIDAARPNPVRAFIAPMLGPSALDGWAYLHAEDDVFRMSLERQGGGEYVIELYQGTDQGTWSAYVAGAPADTRSAARVASEVSESRAAAGTIGRFGLAAAVVAVLTFFAWRL